MGAFGNYNLKGETVTWQGKEAKVISCEGAYTTITVDGKTISVRTAELMRNSIYNTSLIKAYKTEIEENKQIIEENKNLWGQMSDQIKACRNQMYSILKNAGVRSYHQIENSEQREKFAELRDNRHSARLTQIKASASVIRAAHETASAVFGLHSNYIA